MDGCFYGRERPSSLILGREGPRLSNFLEGNHLIPVNLHFLISNFISGVFQKESGGREIRESGKRDMREREIREKEISQRGRRERGPFLVENERVFWYLDIFHR